MIKFYNLWEFYHHDLFNDIEIPEGLDREKLINSCFLKVAPYTPIYTEHELLQIAIRQFFAVWKPNFEKIKAVLEDDYNPLHNFDRHEEIDEKESHTGTINNQKETGTESGAETIEKENTGRTTETRTSGSDTGKVSAFNSEDWSNSEKDETENSGNETEQNAKDAKTTQNAKAQENENGTETRKLRDRHKANNHLYGNIGVTTSQQMLESEIALRNRFNIYEYIALKFFDELFIHIPL